MEGTTQALTSMICGIASVCIGAYMLLVDVDYYESGALIASILGLAAGIVAICLASVAKKMGNTTGINTAGKVLGIVGTCITGICCFIALVVY